MLHSMLGNIVNTGAIIAGSLIGVLFHGKLPKKIMDSVLNSIALGIILIGLLNAFKVEHMLLVLLSLVIGTVIGEVLNIEKKLESLGNLLEKKGSPKEATHDDQSISKSFVAASLLFCVGSMAILGALESGLTGQHDTLFAKAILDGITAIIFTSSLGKGVIFSAAPVFLYQGLIVISASFLKPFLVPAAIANMSAVGGLLIFALGLNMLGLCKIKVGNMLPTIFIPLIYFFILSIV